MSTPVFCDPCCYDNKTVQANTWCVECEEGFCQDCQKVHKATKISRGHNLITIDDYRNTQHVTVDQICNQHNKKFDWFCKSHDEPLCKACVSSEHKICPDVVPLEDVAINAKHSTVTDDLGDTINRSLQNIEHFIRDRHSVSDSIQAKRREIEKNIKATREKVVLYLDELQQRLLQELSSMADDCLSESSKHLECFEHSKKTLTKLKEQTLKLKDFASDLHIFLGTRKLYKDVNKEIEFIKLATDRSRSYHIELDLHPIIDNLSEQIDQLGKIKLEKRESGLLSYDTKIGQAQIQRKQIKERPIQDIVLKLDKQLNLQKHNGVICVYGCVILPDGHILIANYHTEINHIQQYNNNGMHIRNISTSYPSFDLEFFGSDGVAVSCGYQNHIDLIKPGYAKNSLKLGFECDGCLGLAYNDGKFYVAGGTKNIMVIDRSGKRVGEVKFNGNTKNIATSGKRIYYTNASMHTIHCCAMDGTEIWTFNDDSIRYPTALSLDNDQNVFVVGRNSNNLVLIQHDGKASKILLKKDDGLSNPNAVYYSKENNSLLVCNKTSGYAALYNVT
ncbi:E3 ubiquitin/ISG15 ligase TRIM25-like [Mytilus trossulus]|uniref:E3 ubiquitin/ISG15 ligase TRIM25-like n=1 Tax=Mytilus trossulus TaxID=6551 RepID=UPI003006FF0F